MPGTKSHPHVQRWPSAATLLAISRQSMELVDLIRACQPKDAVARAWRNADIDIIRTECRRLTYLFSGRTNEEYNQDLQIIRDLDYEPTLTALIAATPGSCESPEFPSICDELKQKAVAAKIVECPGGIKIEQDADGAEDADSSNIVRRPDAAGWSASISKRYDNLFVATADLRVYFGEFVFARNTWWSGMNWLLRHEMTDCKACEEQHSPLLKWFSGSTCRVPLYFQNLRRDFQNLPRVGRLTGVNYQRLSPKVEAHGAWWEHKTESVPEEWLVAAEYSADLLANKVRDQEAPPALGASGAGARNTRNNSHVTSQRYYTEDDKGRLTIDLTGSDSELIGESGCDALLTLD
ncbi:MAG: hypothetical protein KDA44_23765, partial [Planctomycetales bacterium]|nr:hypothetical protein [Planctomycetales bacterium]